MTRERPLMRPWRQLIRKLAQVNLLPIRILRLKHESFTLPLRSYDRMHLNRETAMRAMDAKITAKTLPVLMLLITLVATTGDCRAKHTRSAAGGTGAAVALSAAALEANTTQSDTPSLDVSDRTVLSVCEGIVRLYGSRADEIWPGYDLSARPFVVYVPDRWAVALNTTCDGSPPGFGPPPAAWPGLGTDFCYAPGTVENLAGQLVFGYEIGDTETVAIGFPGSLADMTDVVPMAFGYITHEAFHQYQDEHFGDIAWAREQLYPIDDAENSALAYLEMLLLTDALQSVAADDMDGAREATSRFLAVRAHRWERADDFIPVYEGGKEVREGTARYVEHRSLDLARSLDRPSSIPGVGTLGPAFQGSALPGNLLDDFSDSMIDGAVPVDDMPRNRIYPVACAQGLLLDYFDAAPDEQEAVPGAQKGGGRGSRGAAPAPPGGWKRAAEESTSTFVFADLLAQRLGLLAEDYPALLERALSEHDFATLVEAAQQAIGRHQDRYRSAMADFESQEGRRIEITFDANGLYRSRHSSGPKLVTDRGANEFCEHYNVYTLQREGTFFELHDSAVLEQNDYDARLKTIIFYAPVITRAELSGDSAPVSGLLVVPPPESESTAEHSFTSIELAGEGFELTYEGEGTITADAEAVAIDLRGE
jgi:hypothetical protein